MFFSPIRCIVDFYLIDQRMFFKINQDRNGQPLNTFGSLYSISITPAFFIILDIVINDEDITPMHLLKITEPRQITRLKYPYNHNDFPLELRCLRIIG